MPSDVKDPDHIAERIALLAQDAPERCDPEEWNDLFIALVSSRAGCELAVARFGPGSSNFVQSSVTCAFARAADNRSLPGIAQVLAYSSVVDRPLADNVAINLSTTMKRTAGILGPDMGSQARQADAIARLAREMLESPSKLVLHSGLSMASRLVHDCNVAGIGLEPSHVEAIRVGVARALALKTMFKRDAAALLRRLDEFMAHP